MTNETSRPPRRHGHAERLERAALILILAVVAVLAGKVAFGRVVDWTMANSPDAMPRSAGWTNGVISELLPIGVLLFIRHQKRQGRAPGALAWIALVGAFLFSLTAQLAQAESNVFGWIVAAMPSAAFMVLSKMVVSMRPAQPTPALETIVGEHHPKVAPVVEPSVSSEPEPEEWRSPALEREPEPINGPQTEPEWQVAPESKPHLPRRVHPRSLTSRTAVEAAAKELGSHASVTAVAAHAQVSESTARRYMPRGA
ncbi:hypothetical protein [Actinoplanes sp. NPDC049265]|uniref:hypothetical protein n=1 Tax=Actinoplanes sp. NPDC049265 TaxID=3363902 RepID=UPI003721AC14